MNDGGEGGVWRILVVCHDKIYLNPLFGSVIFSWFPLIGPLTLVVTTDPPFILPENHVICSKFSSPVPFRQ